MQPESEEIPHRSRKNTRRWCKGRVGREHVTEIRDNRHLASIGCSPARSWLPCVEQEVCTVCGKVVRFTLDSDCTRLRTAI